jgi:hypothetical protein
MAEKRVFPAVLVVPWKARTMGISSDGSTRDVVNPLIGPLPLVHFKNLIDKWSVCACATGAVSRCVDSNIRFETQRALQLLEQLSMRKP